MINSCILGDCRVKLKDIPSKSIDLIYLDPPFYTQKEQCLKDRKNDKLYSFHDTWKNLEEYKAYIEQSLVECYRILKDTGNIFLHCDKIASHYLRISLDKIFGYQNFQSEIIWYYKRWSNSKKGLLNSHQNIYFYSKSAEFKFNNIYTSYSPTTNVDQILQERRREIDGRCVYKKNNDGDIIQSTTKKGVPLSDVWEIPFLNPKARERTGYPTQKPIELIERIINIGSDIGDTILDPFCGSGTTLVAAKMLNRNFIGVDISNDALDLTKKRLDNLVKTQSKLLRIGKESYLNKSDKENSILKFLNAIPVYRNSGIDAFIKNEDSNLIPIKIQKMNENLDDAIEKLLKASLSKNFKKQILIQTSNYEEKTLFQSQIQDGLLILSDYHLLIDYWL